MTETVKKPDPATAPAEKDALAKDAAGGADSQAESAEDALRQELEDAKKTAGEYQDRVLRMQAEMENLQKRAQRDVSNAHKYAIEKFASELLQVKDGLELGPGCGGCGGSETAGRNSADPENAGQHLAEVCNRGN